MADAAGPIGHAQANETKIILGLLQSVERDGAQSQRGRASELGIALGLLNFYLRRCVAKGLLKVSKAPLRRYAYYLTPRGFFEKSRLTVQYLSFSFELFRRARTEYGDVFRQIRAHGYKRCALAGVSDLAEIAILCAIEMDVRIVAVVDPSSAAKQLIGVSVLTSFCSLPSRVDAVVVTDAGAAQHMWEACLERFGPARAFMPPLLELPVVPDRASPR